MRRFAAPCAALVALTTSIATASNCLRRAAVVELDTRCSLPAQEQGDNACCIGLEGEHWSATAWGRNITDEEYLAEVIPAAEFGGSFIHPATLATYGVDFSYRF